MKKKAEDINQELAHTKILPLLIRLTIPVTIAQFVNVLYSIVDRMYIGHMPDVGVTALSSIGLTFPIIMLITAFSCLTGMGGAPLASIAIGEGDLKKAQKYLCNCVTISLIISLIITVGCLLFLQPLLVMFGADAQTLPYATEYLGVYLIGTVFVELSMGLNPFINAQGHTLVGTISVVIGAVLNIVLDPILIYQFNMGIKGAAVATVISQFVSCLWVLWFLLSDKSQIRIRIKDMSLDPEICKNTCKLGISPFTFRINESIVVILLNHLLLKYGGAAANLHIASLAVLNSISQIFFMPLLGIVTGAQPILSYNYGAKNFQRVRSTIHYARILSFASACFMWLIIMVFPKQLCLLFTNDPELIALSEKTMRIMFCTVFVLGFQMINQNAFVAMGNVRYSFLFGIMRKVLILLPLAYIFPHFIGVWGIYIAETISNPITTIITFFAFERFMRKLDHNFSYSP